MGYEQIRREVDNSRTHKITNVHLVEIQNLLADIIKEQQRTNGMFAELFALLEAQK
jgi:hypothetical protein